MISAPATYAPRFIPLRMPRVCIAITGNDANDMIEKAESLARDLGIDVSGLAGAERDEVENAAPAPALRLGDVALDLALELLAELRRAEDRRQRANYRHPGC